MTSRRIRLRTDLVFHGLHFSIVKIRIVIIAIQYRIGHEKLFGYAPGYFLKARLIWILIINSIKQYIRIYIIPPVAAISTTQQRHLGTGVVHHNIPAGLFIEIIFQHGHIVKVLLAAFVDAHQRSAHYGTHGGKGLVKFSVIIGRSLAHIAYSGIQPNHHLRKILITVILPYHGPEFAPGIKIIDSTVKSQRQLLIVYYLQRLWYIGHLRNTGYILLRYGKVFTLFASRKKNANKNDP